MPLEEIRLKDFQRHADLTLELSPTVTTIVGPSDEGKSSVIRALSLVLLNNLSGKKFVRHGRESCRVTLKIDGRKVTRRKGKANTYSLDGKKFTADPTARGSWVPDEVKELLNVSDLNFQYQLSPPFWFFDSPGQVSKNLNGIVNLGSIDRSLAKAKSLVSSVKSELKLTETRLEEAKHTRDELKWVKELVEKREHIRALKAAWQQTAQDCDRLAILVRDGSEVIRTRDRAANAIVGVGNAIAACQRLLKTQKEVETLSALVREGRKFQRVLEKPIPDISKLLEVRKKADQVAEDCRTLEMLIQEAKQLEEDRCRAEERIKEIDGKLRGETCPACGQKLPSRLPSPSPTSTPNPARLPLERKKIGTKSSPNI
jgi:exonuclease SbcC